MTNSIPASQLVRVIPSVLAPGGTGLSLNSVFLTTDEAVPNGVVLSFPTLDAVKAFFGATSPEADAAAIYFNGFEGATTLPTTLYFARWNAAASSAYLRSGSLAAMTLTELQAISGVITISIDGTPVVSDPINLSGATSFSNAAAIIQTALLASAPGVATVVYDSQRAAFVVETTSTGTAATIGFATGTASTALKLTAATGAVLSQGAAASTATGILDGVVSVTQNWALFTTLWEPNDAEKLAFADWVNASNLRYGYVGWDTDVGPTLSNNDPGSFGRVTMEYDGVIPVWGPVDKAAFICGAAASINFNATQGRITFAYKSQSGLTADVTDATVAQNLLENGYNFYGDYATANENFLFLQNGQISGEWRWIDEYVNQIKLNSDLQLAFMTLLSQVTSLPYNARGYNLMRAAAADPITRHLNFGSIQPGVELSALQIAQIDTTAGITGVGRTVSQVGYYLQVNPAPPAVRAERGSPPSTLWYASGGSIQKIDLASVAVL